MKKLFTVIVCVITVAVTLVSASVGAYAAEEPNFEFNTDTLLLVNSDTDEVLFSKNADVERVMASTTKIMTYIVAAEQIKDLINTKITVEQQPIDDVLGQDASMAGFQNHIGETYSALDVLYGLMIPSGCEAAEMLAYYVGNGNVQAFVDMMNDKAKELGCYNTHYNDSHGLSDENHYTTASDLYKITKYALTMPYFKQIVSTEFYTLPGEAYPMINTNYLIDYVNGGRYYYQYATGIKTGYTEVAGKCLVSMAEKGDTNLICIALGADYGEDTDYVNYAMLDSVELYKWAFDKFTENIDVSFDSQYASVQLGEQKKLDLHITSSNVDEIPVIKWSSSNENVATVDENGVVTAHALGEAVIRAQTQTGNFAQLNLACGYYNGIDVTSRCGDFTSGSKEPIDWTAVKNSGIDFAIIRAGWGSEDYPDQNDATFVENVKGAVENGIPIGLNFVSYAVDTETARLEAEYLLREIEDYIPDYKSFIALPISYNMTDSQFAEFSTEQNTQIALEFNRVMNENGFETMCYANKKIFSNIDVAALKNSGMALWYAYYPYQPDFSEKILVNDEFVPELWQYRTDGYLPEASEDMRTRQSIIYMLSSEFEQYQPPEAEASQIDDENAVLITWSAPSYKIDGYTIYRISSNDNELVKLADLPVGESEYIDNGLDYDLSYSYYVAARVSDFFDKTYVMEILGAVPYQITLEKPSEDVTDPSSPTEGTETSTEGTEPSTDGTEPSTEAPTAADSSVSAPTDAPTGGSAAVAPSQEQLSGQSSEGGNQKGDVNTGSDSVCAAFVLTSCAAAAVYALIEKRRRSAR